MMTARPLQKVFLPLRKSTKKNQSHQPFIHNRMSYNYEEEDDYGEISFPQFRLPQNCVERSSSEATCSKVYHKRYVSPHHDNRKSKLVQKNSKNIIEKNKISSNIEPMSKSSFLLNTPKTSNQCKMLLNMNNMPPPIPKKPHHLRYAYNATVAPPLPPRIVNLNAIQQRRQLNDEYFENIRKEVKEKPNSTIKQEYVSVRIPGTERRPYWTIEDSQSAMGSSKVSSTKKRSSKTVTSSSKSELLESLTQLKFAAWYWADLSWEEAEILLSCQSEPGRRANSIELPRYPRRN